MGPPEPDRFGGRTSPKIPSGSWNPPVIGPTFFGSREPGVRGPPWTPRSVPYLPTSLDRPYPEDYLRGGRRSSEGEGRRTRGWGPGSPEWTGPG